MALFGKIRSIGGNKKRVLENVAWAMVGKVVNMAGSLFVGILVARYLGPSQYGLMNYIVSFVTLFTVISNFGLDNIEIRELSRWPEKRNQIMGSCFVIRLICTTIAIICIGIILIVSGKDSFTTKMILCYSLSLYPVCFNVVRNYFTSIVKNEYIVKSEISRTLIGAMIKVILLLITAPLEFFILASIFDIVLVASGYVISYQRVVGSLNQWRIDREQVSFLVKESFPLVLSGAAVIVYNRIDQVMIGDMIDKESVGYFATADKFLGLILFLPGVLVQTVTPILVRIKREESSEVFEAKAQEFVGIAIWVAIFFAFVTMLCSYYLVYFTYGTDYLAAVPVLQILAWKTVGMAISSSGGQLIIMENIQRWAVFKNLMGCVACVALNYIMIPRFGIIGSAWVTIITVAISGFLGNIFIPPYHKILRIEAKALLFGWKDLLKITSIVRQ